MPATVPYKNAEITVNGASLVDQRLLHAGYCVLIDPIEVTQEKCGNCVKAEYKISITGGLALRNDELDIKNDSFDGFSVTDSDLEKIKEIGSKAKLCPGCGNETWTITINKTEYFSSEDPKTFTM